MASEGKKRAHSSAKSTGRGRSRAAAQQTKSRHSKTPAKTPAQQKPSDVASEFAAGDPRDTSVGTSGPTASTPAEESVQFINGEVLNPPAQGDLEFAKPMAAQVAVMMSEDARSFIQGTEQVLVVAIARALDQMLETDGAEGATTLAACENLMTLLPTFATDMATAATAVSGELS